MLSVQPEARERQGLRHRAAKHGRGAETDRGAWRTNSERFSGRSQRGVDDAVTSSHVAKGSAAGTGSVCCVTGLAMLMNLGIVPRV